MSDYTVMVEGQARVFLGGPPLVKMAIGEDADEEELGGAAMHARTSGLCDYLARDEPEALRMARGIVGHLHWPRLGPGPAGPADPPSYPAEELLGIASVDVRVPFDVREILARVVDGSRFEEFKELYGAQLVCGWASLGGYPIGVVANNGILFSPEAQKGAQFIALCNRTDTPILFVQNITGFMVGTRYEQGGIIKDGAKLINAVSNSTVPHLTLMVGASYGAGNYAMAGRAYDPRFVFTWPNHRIAVMGPKQLAGVLSIVRRNAAEAAGRPFDEAADEELRLATESQIEEESTAQYATGRLWDDGIIDPRDTRTVLAIALTAVHSAPVVGRRSSAWCGTDGAGPIRRLLVANRGEIARRLIRGRARRRVRGRRRLRGGRRRQPPRRRGRHRRAAARGHARRDVPRPRRAGARPPGPAGPTPCTRATGSSPRTPPWPKRARRGHRLGRPAARGDAGHGPQGAAKEVVADAGVPVLPSARGRATGGGRGTLTAAAAAVGLPASRQGVGRRRRPGHAARARARRAGRRRRLGPAGGGGRVRLRRRLPGAVPVGPPARRGPGHRGHPRHRAAPLRPGVLGAAAAPEGGRGGPGRPRAADSRPRTCGRPRWRWPGPSATWARARSSAWSTPAASTSWR